MSAGEITGKTQGDPLRPGGLGVDAQPRSSRVMRQLPGTGIAEAARTKGDLPLGRAALDLR